MKYIISLYFLILYFPLPLFGQSSLLNPNNFVSLDTTFNPESDITINMAAGTMSGGAVYTGVVQDGILIFTFDNFILAEGRTISFSHIPSLGNAVAFLSKGNMSIAGTIDASAADSLPGPGGGTGAGDVYQWSKNGDGPGGGIGGIYGTPLSILCGGGGFGGRGGGNDSIHTSASSDTAGSAPYGDLSLVLQGGSGGGHGYFAGNDTTKTYGGGGGGALELGARETLTLQSTSKILAIGGIGQTPNWLDFDGCGGGSGGGILLHSLNIALLPGAEIDASGGRGGHGGSRVGYGGGGGGGGRISIYYSTEGTGTNNGTILLNGGAGGGMGSGPYALDGQAGENGIFIFSESSINALPVELNSMNAAIENNSIILHWSTVSENNNYGFEIERRRIHSGQWQRIGFVQGAGASNVPKAYSYTDADVSTGQYAYRLKQIDMNGTYSYSSGIEVSVAAPAIFSLDQNYPNPFNPETTISFTLPVSGKVILAIFDVLGKKIETLVNTELPAGIKHTVSFRASHLSSGMYFYRLESGNNVQIKKLVLLK